MRNFFLAWMLLLPLASMAGAKADFIEAVRLQCGKKKSEAARLATPGRSGNVIKYKTCTSVKIKIEDCTLRCKDASSSIGG